MLSSIDHDLAQQIVNTVKDVCGHDVNFIDCSGIIFASTDIQRIGTFHEIGRKAAQIGHMLEVDTNTEFSGTYKGVNLPVYYKDSIIAVIGISGEPEEVRKFAYLAERITRLLIREQEVNAFSRTQAEKRHYILHALISGKFENYDYIFHCLEEMHIEKDSEKRLLIVRLNTAYRLDNLPAMEQQILDLFSRTGTVLYTYHYPNEYLALMEEGAFIQYTDDLQAFADKYADCLCLAVGKAVRGISLADSYSSAMTALNSLSDTKLHFAVFDHLTLELFLSSMTPENRNAYLKRTIFHLTEAELSLLSVYFENDMSLLQTAQQLFLHKNTLQYKLDHIYKKCGLNPRKFRDAILLYLAVKIRTDYTKKEAQNDR